MRFSKKQRTFLKGCYVAHIATSTVKGVHISPIYFEIDSDAIFFATEETTMKFKDLRRNPRAALVIDYFDASWLHGKKGTRVSTTEKAIVIKGRARIFTNGKSLDYGRMYRKLFQKYPDYREQNWKRGESPIVRVLAESISEWGI